MTNLPIDTLTIATRKSPLALWQANHVKACLQVLHPTLTIHLLPMTSRGDHLLDTPLAKVGGKGLFVKELEHSLLNGEADIAVHSMKDVPMALPSGLELSVICAREDPRDAFVSDRYPTIDSLPAGSLVGTSSLRRQCQLLRQRPDLEVSFLRGNINTRLHKLKTGQYDAIILAAAGLLRLEMAEQITQYLSPDYCLPSAGQGAIGIECRHNDQHIQQCLAALDDPQTRACVTAERAMNRYLEGGCQLPIAGYATYTDEHLPNGQKQLRLRGLVGTPDGRTIITDDAVGMPDDAETVGINVAQGLLAIGADRILHPWSNFSSAVP